AGRDRSGHLRAAISAEAGVRLVVGAARRATHPVKQDNTGRSAKPRVLPSKLGMSQILDRVLQAARQLGASDVHLKAGLPPIFRIKGDLRTVRDVPPLTRDVLQTFALGIMNDRQREIYERHWDVDLAYATNDGARYRVNVNVFQQRGAVGMVMRLIPPDVPPFQKLNLPGAVLDLADSERGMVLVTGITGSGKSTT